MSKFLLVKKPFIKIEIIFNTQHTNKLKMYYGMVKPLLITTKWTQSCKLNNAPNIIRKDETILTD
jgi:hypothetical protein